MEENLRYVQGHLSSAALLEQLAEESAELAQAALKLSRILRKENPTPVRYSDAVENVIEEAGDVDLCLKALDFSVDPDFEKRKLERWVTRLDPDRRPRRNRG